METTAQFREQLEVLELQLQAQTSHADRYRRDAETWERRYRALEVFTEGLTHHSLTSARHLQRIADSFPVEPGDNDASLERLQRLKDLAERSGRLSQALLNGAKVSASGIAQPISLAQVFTEALDELKEPISRTKARIERPCLPMIVGDCHAWQRLFVAILENSLLYSRAQPVIALQAEESLDQLLLLFSDNGPGIPDDYLDQVFLPFRRLHTAGEYPGVGLGLTLCREIVQRMNGRIWLSPRRDTTGLVVHVVVPRHARLNLAKD